MRLIELKHGTRFKLSWAPGRIFIKVGAIGCTRYRDVECKATWYGGHSWDCEIVEN